MTTKGWVHIIGIAGVMSSSLAQMLKEEGFLVTGSDEQVYPPATDILDKAGIHYFNGFSYKNLIDSEGKYPDLVILAGAKSSKNKEVLFAKKRGLKIQTSAEVIRDFILVNNQSIVVTGTYGKTSITAMLSYLLRESGRKVSYMFGGFTASLTYNMKPKTNATELSIIEGDEYFASKDEMKSKFFYYKPTVLVINAIEWDHTDMFKTEEDYIQNFKNYVETLTSQDIIFAAKTENIEKVVQNVKAKVIFLDYEQFKVKTSLIGKFNNDNAAAVNQICQFLGLDSELVAKLMVQFKGLKRRLEVRYKSEDLIIIDDFGSSPAKAKGSIKSVKNEFPDFGIISVYEPNEGARTEESLTLYKNVFDDVKLILLPEFRKVINRISEVELSSQLKSINYNSELVKSSEELWNKVKSLEKKTIILFLGSHSFEDKIQYLISKLDEETKKV